MYFHLSESRVIVEEIEKGYSDETLNTPGNEEAINREAQLPSMLGSMEETLRRSIAGAASAVSINFEL